MPFSGFPAHTQSFLADLAENNAKDWFDANRKRYEPLLAASKAFVDALGPRLQEHDPELGYAPGVNGSLFRINRDTRFATDKRPYKTELGFRFWRGASPKDGQSGLLMRITPSFVGYAAGIWSFEPPVLEHYRAAVAGPAGVALAGALGAFNQTSHSEAMEGAGHMNACTYSAEAYKRVPKPYAQDHERGELLKLKGLVVGVNLPTPASLSSAAFVDDCAAAFEPLLPVHHWLAEHARA